jgi:hypothetical protein
MPPKKKVNVGTLVKKEKEFGTWERKCLVKEAEIEAKSEEFSLLQADYQRLDVECDAIKTKKVDLEKEYVRLKNQLEKVESECAKLQANVRNKQRTLQRRMVAAGELDLRLCSKYDGKTAFIITSSKAKKRKVAPTSPELNEKRRILRRGESFDAELKIHGGSNADKSPALDGMIDTITAKFPITQVANKILSEDCKVNTRVRSISIAEHNDKMYKSEANVLRSINSYFSHKVMGKVAYQELRRANTGFGVNYIPYKDLMVAINNIDNNSESIQSIHPTLTDGVEGMTERSGVYRSCDQYLLHLASFYLKVNASREDEFLQFPSLPKRNPSATRFDIAFGGDHAPGN